MCSKNRKSRAIDSVVSDLKEMLDEHNILAKSFRMAAERFKVDDNSSVRLRLIGKRTRDGRMYDLPTCNEVAALIVGMRFFCLTILEYI